MNRPPSVFAVPLADAAAYTARFGTDPVTRLGVHRLQAVETADGVLAGTWGLVPPGAADATFALPLTAGCRDLELATIDPNATTCWPLNLYYGSLGVGGR